MKNRLRSLIISICILSIPIIFLGCSKPPSDEIIKEIMTKEHYGTASGGVKNFKYDVFEIRDRGKFNKDRKYWPFKVFVKGTYTWFGENRRFEGITEVKFSKDDYGNWIASGSRSAFPER